MEQIKEHYEKAILGLAMLALVYVAYGVLTDNSEEAIAEQIQARSRPALEQKKEMSPMDMRGYHGTLARLEKDEPLNLSNPHNLFNPVQWRVTRQGTTLKVELGNEIGAGAIELSRNPAALPEDRVPWHHRPRRKHPVPLCRHARGGRNQEETAPHDHHGPAER